MGNRTLHHQGPAPNTNTVVRDIREVHPAIFGSSGPFAGLHSAECKRAWLWSDERAAQLVDQYLNTRILEERCSLVRRSGTGEVADRTRMWQPFVSAYYDWLVDLSRADGSRKDRPRCTDKRDLRLLWPGLLLR